MGWLDEYKGKPKMDAEAEIEFKTELKNRFEDVVDPHTTVDDADNYSRDRYYFTEGVKAAYQLLLDKEFDIDQFMSENGDVAGWFSSAISTFKISVLATDKINRNELANRLKAIADRGFKDV